MCILSSCGLDSTGKWQGCYFPNASGLGRQPDLTDVSAVAWWIQRMKASYCGMLSFNGKWFTAPVVVCCTMLAQFCSRLCYDAGVGKKIPRHTWRECCYLVLDATKMPQELLHLHCGTLMWNLPYLSCTESQNTQGCSQHFMIVWCQSWGKKQEFKAKYWLSNKSRKCWQHSAQHKLWKEKQTSCFSFTFKWKH